MLDSKKIIKPDLKSEMDELQRVVQDLSRDENIEITVNELVTAFNKSKETTLTSEIWNKLENTESNEIEKGDVRTVYKIAKMYNKTSPKKLSQSLKRGDYKRPLIVKFGDRYHLVAGNTRLCTAAVMGIKPNVFIANIDTNKEVETKEETGADSSGSFSGPAFGGTILKKDLYKLHNTKKYNMNEDEVEFKEATDASSSGSYDVPAFGKTSKGRKNPLKIDGEKSIKQSRAVKDKNFPKWGGPNSVFIKVKDKCKKFPYCNQGDINAIELLEITELNESISEISKELGIPYKEIEKIVLNEIKQIFI
jgi:hypothetical protein